MLLHSLFIWCSWMSTTCLHPYIPIYSKLMLCNYFKYTYHISTDSMWLRLLPLLPRASMDGRGLLVVYVLLFPTVREVPHGTKGTGPRFVMRPVYSRSQHRNNANTVSVLVLLMYLFHILYTRFRGIAHHRALQTSGRGWLTPRQYTEWNVTGARTLYWRSLSVGAAA